MHVARTRLTSLLPLLSDVKYIRFRQEINSLGESLRRLETILRNACIQCPSRPWQTDSDLFRDAFRHLFEVTGDFHKTLRDCHRLLKDHARLQHGGASIADNMAWWTKTEGDVTILRERVTFHITKVSFIAKPFETQLLSEIRRDLQLLRNDVAELRGIMTNGQVQPRDSTITSYLQSVHVPHELASRFTTALHTNKPSGFTEPYEWPVKEGFNALVFHFAKSTVEFSSNRRLGQNVPDPPQYLNLLKSVWIMRQIKDSPHFRSTGTDSLWTDYMRELEMDIKTQLHRFDAQQLIAPPISDLLQLTDEYYTVWVDEEPPLQSLDIVEQRPLEEKILELALPESYGNRQTSLTVLRKSEYEFRLVKMTKMADNPFYHSEEGSNVNMNSTRLIPAYRTPGVESADAQNLALCNDRGQHEEWHLLKGPNDVAALQRALTGYRIHHEMSGFSWCINGSKEPEDFGTGSLQMWQLKPLPKVELDLGKPVERVMSNLSQLTACQLAAVNDNPWQPGSASPNMTSSGKITCPDFVILINQGLFPGFSSLGTRPRTGSDIRSLGTSHTTLLSGTSMTATVNGPRSGGIELMRPEAPSLIIFTMCQGRYTFLHMKRKQIGHSSRSHLCAHCCQWSKRFSSIPNPVLAANPGRSARG